MFNNNNNQSGKAPDESDLTNRSNNLFIANNQINQAAQNSYNAYDQINEKSDFSNISAINQNSNFKNLELEKINCNNVKNYLNDNNNNNNINVYIPGQALEYSQISNMDSSRFTNIPLNDLNNNNNINIAAPALGFSNSEKPGFSKPNPNNNLTQNPTLITNNLQNNNNNNNNYNKLATNVTGIPTSIAKGAAAADISSKPAVSADDKAKDHLIEKRNKTVSYCYYIFHLALLIILIPTISLIYMAKQKLNLSELSYFAEIFSNWRQSAISDVSLNCSDKSKETLINDWWPGTASGCFCSEKVSWGRCPRRSYCQSISVVSPIKYKFWKANQICVARIEGGYLDLVLAKSAGECPQNTKSCGVADTQGNFLCVDKSQNCPINKIFKSDASYKAASGEFVLSLGDSTLVLSRDNKAAAVPVQFKVAFGQPCLNPYFENLNFDVYRLNYFFGKQRCYMYADYSEQSTAVFDVSYALIDSYAGESFYAENGIKSAVAALPLFDAKEFQRPISLYAKSHFGLKLNCFKKIQSGENYLSEMISDSISISYLDDLTSTFVASLVIQFIVMVMMIMIICCFRGTINPKKKHKPVRITSSHLCCYCILFVIMALSYFIFIGVNSNSASNLQLTDTFHEVFGSPECVDDFTVDVYERFVPSIDSARKYLRNANLLMGLILLSQLVFFVFAFYKISKTDFYDDEE